MNEPASAGPSNRDPTAHREILRLLVEQRSSLFAFILSIVRDFDQAEDVFQDESVVICEHYADFRLGTDFGAWSREIARRRILAVHRKSRKSPQLLPEESLRQIQAGFDAVTSEAPGEVEARRKALRHCMQGLESFAARLLALRDVEGFGLERLAADLERHPESIRKSLYRTRQVHRECIERRLRMEGGRP
jgi:RNA polymerase sigma-70 factor (ECF subfamily)